MGGGWEPKWAGLDGDRLGLRFHEAEEKSTDRQSRSTRSSLVPSKFGPEGAFCKPIQGLTKAGSKRRIQPHEADWFLLRHFSGCPGLAQARCMLLVSMQLAMGEAR